MTSDTKSGMKGSIYRASNGAAEYSLYTDHIKIIDVRISRPEIRAGSALAAGAGPGQGTTITLPWPCIMESLRIQFEA